MQVTMLCLVPETRMGVQQFDFRQGEALGGDALLCYREECLHASLGWLPFNEIFFHHPSNSYPPLVWLQASSWSLTPEFLMYLNSFFLL